MNGPNEYDNGDTLTRDVMVGVAVALTVGAVFALIVLAFLLFCVLFVRP